ncbi:MAG: DUF2461 domain-containing protein [Prevotella sp.]
MKTRLILDFLSDIKVNNNRQWFQANKDRYMEVRTEFETFVADAITCISEFDNTISHITVKDATYRFYRDTRFSQDKSPYKRHLGAYIAAHGKKSLHGGYYIHFEPGNCLLACGNYYLPTNILTSCRNEIMANIDRWLDIVESKAFVKTFGKAGVAEWGDERGFGLETLKKAPSGFPRDYEHIEYLRLKDYCCWTRISDDFFASDNWRKAMTEIFLIGKPMMDFINDVVDDYED